MLFILELSLVSRFSSNFKVLAQGVTSAQIQHFKKCTHSFKACTHIALKLKTNKTETFYDLIYKDATLRECLLF